MEEYPFPTFPHKLSAPRAGFLQEAAVASSCPEEGVSSTTLLFPEIFFLLQPIILRSERQKSVFIFFNNSLFHFLLPDVGR